MRKEQIASGLPSESVIVTKNSQTIFITQELGVTLELAVSLFQTEPSDVTAYVWHDKEGNMQTLDMPPYYISDMPQALVNIQLYGQSTSQLYTEYLLKDANPIIRITFDAAHCYARLFKVRVNCKSCYVG